MNILAFDTSHAACSAAAVRGMDPHAPPEAAAPAAAFEPMATGHAERLPRMIADVMEAAGLAFADLDRIAVTTGPGSFTGTRIAVAAARALALSFPRCAVVAASSLAVMAVTAVRTLREDGAQPRNCVDPALPLLIAVDARRGEVYVQQFQAGGGEAVSGPLLLPVAEAASLGGAGPLVVAGSGAHAVAEAARAAGRDFRPHLPELLPDARDLCRLAVTLEPARGPIKPLYLRPADAKPQTGKSIERVAS